MRKFEQRFPRSAVMTAQTLLILAQGWRCSMAADDNAVDLKIINKLVKFSGIVAQIIAAKSPPVWREHFTASLSIIICFRSRTLRVSFRCRSTRARSEHLWQTLGRLLQENRTISKGWRTNKQSVFKIYVTRAARASMTRKMYKQKTHRDINFKLVGNCCGIRL